MFFRFSSIHFLKQSTISSMVISSDSSAIKMSLDDSSSSSHLSSIRKSKARSPMVSNISFFIVDWLILQLLFDDCVCRKAHYECEQGEYKNCIFHCWLIFIAALMRAAASVIAKSPIMLVLIPNCFLVKRLLPLRHSYLLAPKNACFLRPLCKQDVVNFKAHPVIFTLP